MGKVPDKIKQRRTRFVKEYLIDQNATRAAIAAGYSEKGASVAGVRLLSNASVKAEVDKGIAKVIEKVNTKLDVSVERVTLELARLAFVDSSQFFNEDGSAKQITELDEDSRRAIAGFEMAELFTGHGEQRATAGYIKKYKISDKVRALEQLGRHLQMFPNRVEISGEVIHTVKDEDIAQRIADLERDLGLARAIDEAGRAGIAQAGAGPTNGKAETADVLPGNGAVKA